MSRDLLKRDLAPITSDALEAVDAEAARVLKLNLAGRRLVDFRGPTAGIWPPSTRAGWTR